MKMNSRLTIEPTIFLQGENLAYFRDIEYLKEMTKRATALMSRSNALYNNILSEVEVGHEARGLSQSTENLSDLTIVGKCEYCGLVHGANYCIVQQILGEEQLKEVKSDVASPRLSKSTLPRKTTWITDFYPNHRCNPQSDENYKNIERESTGPRLFDEMSPEKLLETYEMLCARYGRSSARRFLHARSLARGGQKYIEPWATSVEETRNNRINNCGQSAAKTTYRLVDTECLPVRRYPMNPLCSNLSGEIREKMEKVVELTPPCECVPFDARKRWSDMFENSRLTDRKSRHREPPSRKTYGASTELESVKIDYECDCGIPECDCKEESTCLSPAVKKPCERPESFENNYLLTIRQRLEKQRDNTKAHRLTFPTSRDLQTVVEPNRKSEEIMVHVGEEHRKILENCLEKMLPEIREENLEIYQGKLEQLVRLSLPVNEVNESKLRNWEKALEEIREDDITDSSDESDVTSECSRFSELSQESDIDYKDQKLSRSRIPFAGETYSLIDILFEKIRLKFEKSILKNTFKQDGFMFKETFAFFMSKIAMHGTGSTELRDVKHQLKYSTTYLKKLTPLSWRKQRKLKRLETRIKERCAVHKRRNNLQGLLTNVTNDP